MAKGHEITVFEPVIWFSPNYGTQLLPKRGLAFGSDWPTGWIKIPYTANGAQWTFVNPKQDISTDEVGVLKSIPAGTHTINVTFQPRTPVWEYAKKINALRTTNYTTRQEQVDYKFATGCTLNGSITIPLPDGVTQTVAVTTTSQSTPALVATAVGAATAPAGWTVLVNPTGTDTARVRYTQTTAAFTSAVPTFSPALTGVTMTTGYPQTIVDGYVAHFKMNLDPSFENHFLIGMDGHYLPNSLDDGGGRVRIIAYAVEQTDNPQNHFRKFGNDALYQPTMTARCVTSVVDPTQQLAASGLTASDIDADGRLDWWAFPAGP